MPELKTFLAVATKHGLWAGLAIATLWFVRTDVLLPMVANQRETNATLKGVEKTLDRLLYHTVKGSWRSTEPPDEPPKVSE